MTQNRDAGAAKPDDISQDAWNAARPAYEELFRVGAFRNAKVVANPQAVIARAIMAASGPMTAMPDRQWLRDKISTDPDEEEIEVRPPGAYAALPPSTPDGGEPVGWRYRPVGAGQHAPDVWLILNGQWPEAWGLDAWEREPLYTHPQFPASLRAGVRT